MKKEQLLNSCHVLNTKGDVSPFVFKLTTYHKINLIFIEQNLKLKFLNYPYKFCQTEK